MLYGRGVVLLVGRLGRDLWVLGHRRWAPSGSGPKLPDRKACHRGDGRMEMSFVGTEMECSVTWKQGGGDRSKQCGIVG